MAVLYFTRYNDMKKEALASFAGIADRGNSNI
jgi:hypothetical protein